MKNERFYLNCHFLDKDECKELGALWDDVEKKWYVPDGLDRTIFKRWWIRTKREDNYTDKDKKLIFLDCPYEYQATVRLKGAKWHTGWKMWYITEDMDPEPFKNWFFKNGK